MHHVGYVHHYDCTVTKENHCNGAQHSEIRLLKHRKYKLYMSTSHQYYFPLPLSSPLPSLPLLPPSPPHCPPRDYSDCVGRREGGVGMCHRRRHGNHLLVPHLPRLPSSQQLCESISLASPIHTSCVCFYDRQSCEFSLLVGGCFTKAPPPATPSAAFVNEA